MIDDTDEEGYKVDEQNRSKCSEHSDVEPPIYNRDKFLTSNNTQDSRALTMDYDEITYCDDI